MIVNQRDKVLFPPNEPVLDRLTIFIFLWAAQAIVHQEFVDEWVISSPVLGWALTILAWATLLWPRYLLLFIGMISVSLIFNMAEWPYVFNHILVETVINITILLAIANVWRSHQRESKQIDTQARNAIFDRFAPVVGVMLVLVYYFAFIAKLNTDFFNPEISCATVLYGDLVDLVPLLPNADWTARVVIWGTILVELAIPLLLTFRRTRYTAIILGLGFHFMLGLIGHRTFSALAFALYSLYLIEPLSHLVNDGIETARKKFGTAVIKRSLYLGRVIAILIALLFAVELMGNYPLAIVRIHPTFWLRM